MTGYGMAAAIRSGVSRGVFSNEAGLGSLAVLHGMSEGKEAKTEAGSAETGNVGDFEVFFDTIIGCSLTAFYCSVYFRTI
ncbi:MAG: alanine:cation symporter family protein [Clostridium fessum]